MIQRYCIEFSFNGTAYNGWQSQKNTAFTVQQKINETLSVILSENIEVLGCGRTDTGVHALQFFAHFDSEKSNLVTDAHKWLHKFNRVLPNDISIKKIHSVSDAFNARFDAVSRTYQYYVHSQKNPFKNGISFFYPHALNVELMNQACQILLKHEDFSCFSKSNTQTKTNNCIITKAYWEIKEDTLVFTIKANRFLRNMVRAIVGTLLDVGSQKILVKDVEKIILSKNRSKAGTSVPACGLFLTNIVYAKDLLTK